jgi:PST family polysaccharide transporter
LSAPTYATRDVADAAKTDDTGNLSRTVARGAGVAWLSGMLVQVVLLVTYIGLARLAPPEVFGTFAAASILVAFGALFVESGMTAALVHRQDRVDEAAATALVSTLLGGIALSLLSAALAPVVGAVFRSGEITTVALAVSGLHLVHAAAIVPTALLQKRLAYVRRAVVDPLWMATYGGVAAVLLVSGFGVWALVVATYASAAVRTALTWALLHQWITPRLASFAMWRELAGYARHVLVSEFLRHAGAIAHTAGIGRFLGTPDLGQYNFGNQIATQASSPVVTASAFVLFPAFTRISSDRERLSSAFQRALTSLCFVAIPLSLAFFPFGKSLAVLLLGPEWAAAGDVLTSLCLVGASVALISISAEVFKATGRPDLLPRMHLLSAIAPISAVAVGVSFGIVAIAACTSIGLASVAASGIWAACAVTHTPRHRAGRIVLAPFVNAASVAVLFFAVDRGVVDPASRHAVVGFLLLIGEAILAGGLYLLAMRLTAPKATAEFVSSFRYLGRATTGAGD